MTMIYAAYYLTLSLLLLGGFLPDGRVWGLNWWGYFPTAAIIVLVLLGVAIPLVNRWLISSQEKPLPETADSQRFYLIAAGFTLLMIAAFHYLSTTTHFLGDGYQNLARLIDSPLVKARELGESLVHIWLKGQIGGDPNFAALMSYRITSVVAGALFLVALVIATKLLYQSLTSRVLHLIGVSTSGFALLFFGYVEHYSLFVMSVALFSLAGMLITKGNLNRWWAAPLCALSIFFHLLGVTLIPSMVYLLTTGSKLGRMIVNCNWKLRVLSGLVIVIGGGALFGYFYTTDPYFRFAFLTPIESLYTIDNYTLFSPTHLADILNLLILLLPPILVVVAASIFLKDRPKQSDRTILFLLLTALSAIVTIFLLDPKIGMPRDWDLFSFAGVPLSLAAYYFLLSRSEDIRTGRRVAVLSIMLGLLVLGPRVAALNTDYIAIEHFENYLKLDHGRSRNAYSLLARYYHSRGNETARDEVLYRYDSGYPERTMIKKVEILREKENGCLEAIPLYYEILKINRSYPDAWWQLGECYDRINRYDSSLIAFQISDGLNPYNPTVLNNLGVAQMYHADYESTEKSLMRALEIGGANETTLVNLVILYRITNRTDKYFFYLEDLTNRFDVRAEYYVAMGGHYFDRQEYRKSAHALDRALEQGLDSNVYFQLRDRFPEIVPYMKIPE